MSPRVAVTATFALAGILFGSWAARIPALTDRLDLSSGQIGIALAGLALGAVLAMPLAGRAAARFGSGPVTRATLGVTGVGLALPALAPDLPVLVLAAVVYGGANGALDVVMNAQGVAVERRLGRPILSSLHAGFSLGGLVGAGLGALGSAAGLDPRVQLPVTGALAVVAALTVVGRAYLPGEADQEDAPPARPRAQRRLRRPDRALAVLGLAAFACLLCEGAAADWSAIYVDDDLAASAQTAALAYGAFSLCMGLGRLAGDRLTVRFGPVALVRAGTVAGGGGLVLGLAASAPVAALLGFAALGAGLSTVVPAIFRAAGELPGSPGRAIAAVSTTGYTGFLAGPPVIGLLAELSSLPVALVLLPLLTLAVASVAGITAPARARAATRRYVPSAA